MTVFQYTILMQIIYQFPPQITKIRWTWEKVGLFQSFAEIEQLNAMVEPQNLV